MADDHDDIWREFHERVNLTGSQLRHWLSSDESKEVGDFRGGDESTGHHSGRRILDILDKKRSELSDDDYQHMAKVNGYVARHLAQRPDGDVTETRWRYSLMNWGHDPEK